MNVKQIFYIILLKLKIVSSSCQSYNLNRIDFTLWRHKLSAVWLLYSHSNWFPF